MGNSLLIYIVAIYIITFIFKKLGIKVKLWALVSGTLLLFGAISILTAGLFAFNMPSSEVATVNGQNIPYLPFIIGIIQLYLGFMLIRIGRGSEAYQSSTKPSKSILVLYAFATLLYVSSYQSFILSIYIPKVFGETTPVPQTGATIYILLSFIVAPLLLFTSKVASAKNFTAFNWWIFFFTLFAFQQIAQFSLMLVYALFMSHKTVFPFLGGLMTTAYIPYSLLLFLLVKGNVDSQVDDIKQTVEV